MTFDDRFLMSLAKSASENSNCIKKQLGCILLLKSGATVMGWNGAPVEIGGCINCPRMHSHSGTDLHLCMAVHAERRCLLHAARSGAATEGSVLYSYMGIPCKDCMLELIEAGVSEIVCIRNALYDNLSKQILNEWIRQGGKFRVFNEVI